MVRQLVVGSLVSAIGIIVHALITVAVIPFIRIAGQRTRPRPSLHLAEVMVALALALTLAHVVEVLIWSVAYAIVNAAPDDANLVYFAFVNYTTLGYGDVTPLPDWRLLGPLTAMNGVLMFGWSAALMFEVLRKTIAHQGVVAASPRQPDEL